MGSFSRLFFYPEFQDGRVASWGISVAWSISDSVSIYRSSPSSAGPVWVSGRELPLKLICSKHEIWPEIASKSLGILQKRPKLHDHWLGYGCCVITKPFLQFRKDIFYQSNCFEKSGWKNLKLPKRRYRAPLRQLQIDSMALNCSKLSANCSKCSEIFSKHAIERLKKVLNHCLKLISDHLRNLFWRFSPVGLWDRVSEVFLAIKWNLTSKKWNL